MTEYAPLLYNDRVKDIFSDQGLDNFLKIKIWDFAIFYIAICITGAYSAFMCFGIKRDN
jgi:preprotein translocase subunit SecG